MKKGYLLIATMVFLGAIILVGYQNCGLSGSKKSHAKVTPVNPDAKATPGIADSTQLNEAQAQAAGGTCNPATNVLRFSPQEPAFRVNCAQLEELKTLIAPNILTAEYFKSGSILMDTAGNIIQVSIVNPPATPKMVGSVPAQMTAFQMVDAGLNTVSLTGGKNLAVVDLSQNFLREEPLLPNNPDVILDENPVCDGATAAESCAKSAGAALPPPAVGEVQLAGCYSVKTGSFPNYNEVMACKLNYSYSGRQVTADDDVKLRLNGALLDYPCHTGTADNQPYTFSHVVTLPPIGSLSADVVMVNEDCGTRIKADHGNPILIANLASAPTSIQPALDIITVQSSISRSSNGDSIITLNLSYRYNASDVYLDGTPKILVACTNSNSKSANLETEASSDQLTFNFQETCTNPSFSIVIQNYNDVTLYTLHPKTNITGTTVNLPPPPGSPSVTLATDDSTCTIDDDRASCSVDYQFTITDIGSKYVGIILNGNLLQVCVPNGTVSAANLAAGVTRPAELAYQNQDTANFHSISAKLFDDDRCSGNSTSIGNTIQFERVACKAGSSYDANRKVCVAGTGTGNNGSGATGTGNTTNFSFSGESPRDCTVERNESFCDNVTVSSSTVSGLNANQAIAIRVNDQPAANWFACLRNGQSLSNVLAGPGPEGAGTSWIGVNNTPAEFKAYLLTGTGTGQVDCGSQMGTLIQGATLTINAECAFGHSRNDSGVCALNSVGSSGAGTGSGAVSFTFANTPNQYCTVPPGESFCSKAIEYIIESVGRVSGLPADKRVLITVGQSGRFACLQNDDKLSQAAVNSDGTSWVGFGNNNHTFKAYLVDKTANGECGTGGEEITNSATDLTVIARCVEHATVNSANICACNTSFEANDDGQCVCRSGWYPLDGGPGCTPCRNGLRPVGETCPSN